MLTGRKHPIDDFEDQPDGSSQGWPPRSLLRILWKRKVHVLLTWGTVSAAVVAVVMLLPATYRGETLILVDQQKIPEKFVSATVNTELQDRLATISQQILSSTRLQKIIDNFKLYEKERKNHVQEEIIDLMRGDIKVTPEKGWIQNRPGAFRVSYEGHDPNTVAQVTNQIGNLFIEENLRSRETMAEGTSDFMKTQLEQAKKNLEEQEKKLSEFKLTYNGELPQQESGLTQELSRLEVQLQGNQDALNRANQNKTTLESSISIAQSTEATLKRLIEAASELSTRPPTPGQPGVASAPKKKSELLEEQLALLTVRYTPSHPDVRNLTLEIEQVKAQEEKDEAAAKAAQSKDAASKKEEAAKRDPTDGAVKETLPSNPEAVRALAAERERIGLLSAQVTTMNAELKTRQADQQKILAQIDSVQARLRRLPMREQEMAEVTRDYQISKANYNSLQDKIFAADMATEMERRQKSERFTVLDPAQIPEKPVSPDRPLFAGLGSFAGLVLSLGFWLFCDIRKNQLLGEWELPDGAVVLGRVPYLVIPPSAGGDRFFKRGLVTASVTVAALGIASATAYLAWIRH
jgi:succinoglycan biosynthesis transport protein ExoP